MAAITRRVFLASGAAVFAAPFVAEAKQAGKRIPQIGILQPGVGSPAWVGAFREGLHERGYVERQNIAVQYRLAEGWAEQCAVIAEFMRLKVDVIVTWGMPAVLAAKHETRAIPVVGVVPDAIDPFFTTGLARLNRSFTGVRIRPNKKDLKSLRLLREALPTVSRISVLHSTTPDLDSIAAANWIHEHRILCGVNVLILDDSFLTGPLNPFLNVRASHRLPVSSEHSALIVDNEGEMCNGVVFPDILHRAAVYVDKILTGARAADLPIEEPTSKYELIIDMKSAKALGLTIPPSLLLRADQVIE